ncbi:ABC transporter substrate-binding protein [Pseudoclavibacter endophyticus]|uniref:ABC transporter substrate-binding protein n=1 Tax=Pseudoclavibacter endophyticus TaxID=1778590 RepID=UPI00166B70C1|nr:ABC transporter substrate-binding protein [Pseudoclavibacter endophyticus]
MSRGQLRPILKDEGSETMTFTAQRKRISSLAGVAVAAILMAGCTPVVSDDGGGSASATPTAGGTLEVAQAGDFQPGQVLATRNGNFAWVRSVFEPLTEFDVDNEPQPVLATEWSFPEDGMSATFTLRDDVTFHSGRQMTAEDVKWTFEKTKDPASASQVGFIAAKFSDIEVTSPTSLTVTFSEKMAPASIFDFLEQTYIVDSETFDGLADGSQIIGTGPYAVSDYSAGVSLTVERNDDWWGEGQYLDSMVFNRVGDSTAQLSALRSGRSQIGYGLSLVDAQGFASDPQFEVLDGGGIIYVLGVDVNQAPFDDVRVRQAIQYGIDRDRINEQVFAGEATVTNLFWAPGAEGTTEEQANHYAYDPDKARELIEEAGATGASVPITVVSLPATQSEYEIIANNLSEIGLVPSAVPVDETTFNSLQNQGDLGPAFLLLHGQVGFGETTMLNSLPSLRADNPSHFDSPEYQELRGDFLTADTDQSGQALSALTDYLLEQAFAVPIVQAPGKFVVSDSVQGLQISKRGAMLFADASLTK